MWSEEIENAVKQYVETEDAEIRNKIFNEVLHEPFKALVGYNIFRFSNCSADDQIHHDVLVHLVENIVKYNSKYNTKYKAYSFARTIVRSYICDILKKREYENMKYVSYNP